MSIESYIHAMPKAELYIQLEGSMQKETLLLIAEQNDVIDNTKRFQEWIRLLEKPNYERLDDLIKTTSSWVRFPEDLTRIVYDLGVALSKQNVRYAEVCVNPALYMQDGGLSSDEILEALTDGRDRVQRGWGVQMQWILCIPRDEPRRGDEVARWTTSAAARKASVVALGLTGAEAIQPVGQFERAFRSVEKKGVPRVVQAGDKLMAEGVLEAINTLIPDRILDGWGTADAPDVQQILRDKQISLAVCMARTLCFGQAESYSAYPLRALYDEDLRVTIGSGMPSLYKTTLTEEYLAAAEHCDFAINEIEELALNAVRATLLPPDEKEAMLSEFTKAYQDLRSEHIASEQAG